MFPRNSEGWGGIFVYEQVKALRRIGIDARAVVGNPIWVPWKSGAGAAKTILIDYYGQARPRWSDMNAVPTLFFPYLAPPARYWARMAALNYRRGLARHLQWLQREFSVDLVHSHTAFLDGNAGVHLARRFRVPLIITEHTGPFTALTETPSKRRQTERALNQADLVLAVSDFLRRQIMREVRIGDPRLIAVLANGYNPEVFKVTSSPQDAGNAIRALWIGGFQPVKQPFLLIDAFARAQQREPRLTLSLVGHGFLEEEVRAHAAALGLGDALRFHPSASRNSIAEHIRNHHFLVVSSETETFGLVVIEAMGCGRPVLTTRCGGPEETVGDAGRGIIVENSIEGLADGFVRMTSRLREFDPIALSRYARDNYSFDVIANRLKAIYERVRGGTGSC
jgi:glycosyltransferase involved in cell wall biosynthesis